MSDIKKDNYVYSFYMYKAAKHFSLCEFAIFFISQRSLVPVIQTKNTENFGHSTKRQKKVIPHKVLFFLENLCWDETFQVFYFPYKW